MNTLIHLMRVREDEPGVFVGRFPDLPGPIVSANDLPNLVIRAREALLAELQRLEAEGHDWPEPQAINELRSNPAPQGDLMLMIEVQVDDTPIRVNISLPERLLKRLDAAAQSQDMTRSGYVAAAVRTRLGREAQAHADEPIVRGLYDELTRVGSRLNETFGPESDIGRVVADLDQRALDGLRAIASGFRAKRTDSSDEN